MAGKREYCVPCRLRMTAGTLLKSNRPHQIATFIMMTGPEKSTYMPLKKYLKPIFIKDLFKSYLSRKKSKQLKPKSNA